MIEIQKAAADTKVEMADLYSVGGKVYQVPAKPTAGDGLEFLAAVGEQGLSVASTLLLKKFVGDEGFLALTRNATNEQINAVLDELQDIMLGALEEAEDEEEEEAAPPPPKKAAPKKRAPRAATGSRAGGAQGKG